MRALRRSCVVALVSGVTALGIGVVPAAATVIDHEQFRNTGSEMVDFCPPIALRFDFDIRGMFLENSHGPDGLVHFAETSHGTFSWTNLANNLTMTTAINQINKDLKVTDNGDGTLTIVNVTSGFVDAEAPDGQKFRIDSGTIRFEYLVDDGGTPTDPNDDVLLDQRIIKPGTGLNEFDNADFCADVRQYIG